MDTDSKYTKARGYNASLPARLQIENVLNTMRTIKGGNDIRQYSSTARRELALSLNVDIVNDMGDVIGTAPKLALIVVSSVFRDFFVKSPDAKAVEIPAHIDDVAVSTLSAWVKSIVSAAGKFGVNLPPLQENLIKVRHAAYHLGMEKYVQHFYKAYKDGLRSRVPLMPECEVLERYAIGPKDEMVNSAGERLAYLRRRGEFNANSVASLAEFLKTHAAIAQAINDADLRATRARRT